MDKLDNSNKEDSIVVLNVISSLVQDIEKKVSGGNIKTKECEKLKLLKEKCCDKYALVSLSALHGIRYLVERRILMGSQTMSMLVSLLPSIHHYGALVSTIGKILLLELQAEISQTGGYICPYNMQIQHPLIIVLKFCPEKSWFEIYNFVLQCIQMTEDIKLEHKIKLLRPIFRHVFWNSSCRGSQLQLKLFSALMLHLDQKELLHFTLEALLWQQLDIYYCMFLEEFFVHLLSKRRAEGREVVCGMTPALAQATKWLIINGYNPESWLRILRACVEVDKAGGSTVLYVLSDAIMDTPSVYINMLIDLCKFIIFTTYCSKYVAYKFVAVILNWFVNPSFLATPLYQTLEQIIYFITEGPNQWKDLTPELNANHFYKTFGKSKPELKFPVDLILASNSWAERKASLVHWLNNLTDSNEHQMHLKLHTFIQGILLCERDRIVVGLCQDLLFKLMDTYKDISFSHLCLLFYKLGREPDPTMQRNFLFSLPKLAVTKRNIPLIVGIIESLKRGSPKIMAPLVIQLYLSMWKLDNRTYSYLHNMLHDGASVDFAWELNVSRAVALKEICRLAPHLHAKDLVGVLSKILNECSGNVSGLPSAIAIEAVTELCKAYVIDVAGTWSAIQPKLRLDKRPRVVKSLCKFFGEIPNLNSSEQKNEELVSDIVSMLWNYTFFKEHEVIRCAYGALSNFPLEDLPLKYFPEAYKVDIKLPKDLDKNSRGSVDVVNLAYVPAECWLQFLSKIEEEVLRDGGDLVTALIERELTSLPKGIFYLPPEKPEPLSYLYLPPRSVCRSLVDHLQKHLGQRPSKEIVRVLSRRYSRLLPPLNWKFLESLMFLDLEFLRHCLTLLAKQGSISSSAKSILDNYFKSVEWDSDKSEQVLFIYTLLPLLCKAVSYDVLRNFLQVTVELSLRTALSDNSSCFQSVLESLTETLRNKTVPVTHKTLIVKELEKVLIKIPPEHKTMKHYARCATEFPMKSIDQMTSVRDVAEINRDWLRRAVTIKCAIAMRPDVKNPLAWLSELTEAAAHFPDEQEFILSTIRSVIRGRRDCDHRVWLQEFTWRIQASITDSSAYQYKKITLFLVDVFLEAVIILSGYDCLFVDADEFGGNEYEKLHVFPQALSALLTFPDWTDMLPKLGTWLQKLLSWKELPQDKARMLVQALFALREVRSFTDENEFVFSFNLNSFPFVTEVCN